MNNIDPLKGWYSPQELAGLPGIPATPSAVIRAAKKNLWSSRTKVRGKGLEYDIRSLPEATRNHILHLAFDHSSTTEPVGTIESTPPVALKPGVVAIRGQVRRKIEDAALLDDKSRAYCDAALILCRAVEGAMAATNCSVKRACSELAQRLVACDTRSDLQLAAEITYLKQRKGADYLGGSAALFGRLQRMYAFFEQGRKAGDPAMYLVPGKREKTGHNPVHIAAFLRFFCLPSRPPVSEAYRKMQPWLIERGIDVPSYSTVCKIESELPVTVKYRGRVTGSEWRSLKTYIQRDVSMFHSNDIWVGDGHSFKAKVQHPIHGQPFTPEITVIIDWVSRKIVGWSVALSESTIAVSDAFRHAQMTTRARPLVYYSDNGSGQTGKMIDHPIAGTLARQCIAHETGIPGNPQARGIIERLANLSNTAYAGKPIDERRAGMRTLDAAVIAAVRQGGGTREGAMATLDKLVASGTYENIDDANRLLPTLTKGGTAANADPSQLADIAIRGKQTFGLTDVGLAIDQAIKAGQLGGFELKDMAKWLPQQMAAGRQSGLYGEAGFRALLAANQASAITAGTKDEAGNNLVNLLAKINAQDTANDAKKLKIDLAGSLANARSKGVNSLDAFVNLTEQIVSKDKRFNDLRRKAASSTGDEQKATYSAMGDIIQGSAIGKIIQDRQALMALIGIMNNRTYMDGIRDKLSGAKGTADDAFSLIAETPSFKAEQLAAEKAIAMQVALDKVNPALGSFAEGLTGLMRDWPSFSASVVGATAGLWALAAAAGAAALPSILTGGSGAGGRAIGAAGRALGWVGRGAGVLGAFSLGYGAGTLLNDGINAGITAFTGRENTLGGLIYDVTHGDQLKANTAAPSGGGMIFQATQQPLRIENKLLLNERVIAESVNEYNTRLGGRN